jgi:subtilisin family serine protease
VDAYIIDTGCDHTHPEFEGRVTQGQFFAGGSAIDENGHGTHVTGTILGKTVGVAKKARGICVRVLDKFGSGSTSGVIAGVAWAAQRAKQSGRKSIANLSLGGGASIVMDRAVAAAVSTGLNFAVAAGNENQNACRVSPAREPSAITVGASQYNDRRAFFSNYGSCVDVFAPGASINSTWLRKGYAVLDGTSMASPHVAGVSALYLAEGAAPQELPSAIARGATPNVLTGINIGSPNLIAHSYPPARNNILNLMQA